jgi:hypothetical protein
VALVCLQRVVIGATERDREFISWR